MKVLTTVVMGLAIVMGLVLALTPFVAEKFFPVPENSVRQAEPEAAAMALKQWFQSPDAQFIAVQAINKKTETGNTAWFSYSVGRAPVEKYIISKKLTQKELTKDIMGTTFSTNQAPATWWQPEALAQKTYFTGEDQGRVVSLIYSPESKRGVLVTRTNKP